MPQRTQNTPDQMPYDQLTLVGKEMGDYDSKEYIYKGQLGTYRLRIGESIVDDEKAYYIYQNNKMFLTLQSTRYRNVLAGKDENGDFFLFRFKGTEVTIYKREYD